ncbi:MAG: TonB-dependent receptor [Campylobacterota bacterium]|nr:TonB-dependent receptor [Campylobacterota bacterium]
MDLQITKIMTIINRLSLFLLLPAFLGASTVDLGTVSIESHKHHELEDRKVMKSSELAKESKGETLGDFLDKESFINSASYGPAVGRPVVKGMDGYRVGITQGNVILNDLSAMSQDHAVGLMPRASKQIELVKGSASLLYGSYSGGVIRVEGEEHQKTLLKEGVRANLNGAYGSNGSGTVAGGTLEVSEYNLSLMFDSYLHQADDYEAGGGLAVNDSDTKTLQNHLVLGWQINENNLLKVYGDWLSKDYGIPNHSKYETRINMEQERFGAVWHLSNAFDIFEHIQTEIQSSSYLHNETEGGSKDGLFGQEQQSISTLFGFDTGDWHHDLHLQYLQSTLEVCHEHGACDHFYDAVRTPVEDGISLTDYYNRTGIMFSHGHPMPNTAEQNVVTALSSKRYFDEDEIGFGLRLGLRAMDIDSDNIQEPWLVSEALIAGYYDPRQDSAISVTTDWMHYFDAQSSLQASLGYIERLASASELYWNGFHHATESYIIGDHTLNVENSINADMDYLTKYGSWSTQLSAYYYHFFNYIYQSPMADEDGNPLLDPFHNSPVWSMEQVGARIYGAALQQAYTHEMQKHRFDITLVLEMIRGEIISGGNIPRMPPLSASINLKHNYGEYTGSMTYKQVDESRFEAKNETSTEGYGWLSAMLSYESKMGATEYSLFLKGENLMDEEARNHLSFLKETAPLPGRQVSVGADIKF